MILHYNNVHTRLAASIDDNDTVITLEAALTEGGVNVPTLAGDTILLGIDDEVLELTAYTAGATTGTVSRGHGDTLGAAHETGAVVANVITKDDVGGTAATSATLARYSDATSFPAFATATGVGEFLTETNGLDGEDVDGTGLAWSDANDRIDVATAGLHNIRGFVEWDSAGTSTGYGQLLVILNNMGAFPLNQPSGAEDLIRFGAAVVWNEIEIVRWLPVGTRITASVTQTSGGALDVNYAELVVKRLPV